MEDKMTTKPSNACQMPDKLWGPSNIWLDQQFYFVHRDDNGGFNRIKYILADLVDKMKDVDHGI